MCTQLETNDGEIVEVDADLFDRAPLQETASVPERVIKTTVSVRFALGKSGGIHVVPQKAPKNLPEARKGALRYAKAH